MSLRILLPIAAAFLCGTAHAQTLASSPVLSYEVSTNLFTLPIEAAEKLGLAPREGETGAEMVYAPDAFRDLAAKLKEVKGYKVFQVSRVHSPPDQSFIVQRTREFRYPTEYEAGMLPGTQLPEGHRFQSGLHPSLFETKNVGLTLQFLLKQAPADLIDLKVETELVGFTGWVAYAKGKTVAPKEGSAPGGGIQLPVFATARSSSTFRIRPGETILMGGYPMLPEQDVEHTIAAKGDRDASVSGQLRFIAISANTPNYDPVATREIAAGAPIRVSSMLVSIPRSKAPKGFLSGGGKKEDSFRLRILDSGAAESLQQLWSDMGARIYPGPELALSPAEQYSANASGILDYTKQTGEEIHLGVRVKGKVEDSSVITLQVEADLTKKPAKGDFTALPVRWSMAAETQQKPDRTNLKREVTLGNGQTLLLVNESTSHPGQVLFLFVKAAAPTK